MPGPFEYDREPKNVSRNDTCLPGNGGFVQAPGVWKVLSLDQQQNEKVDV